MRRLRVGTGVLVIDLANGTTVESIGIAAKLRGLDAQIANGTPGLREISYASTGNEALVSNGGRSTSKAKGTFTSSTPAPPGNLAVLRDHDPRTSWK